MTNKRRRFLSRYAVLLAVILATSNTSWGQNKASVPSEAAQAKALELVKEVFAAQWEAARTSPQKQALATALLQKATEATDTTNRYVLLEVARDMAAGVGDAALAIRAIDAMAARYNVDAYRLKGNTLARAAKTVRLQKHFGAVAEHALTLIDEAVERDDFAAAGYLGAMALENARKGKDYELIKQANLRNQQIAEIAAAYAEIQNALLILKSDSANSAAKLAVGKYHCFFKGDWIRGLPMLATGSDSPLKQLAAKELGGISGASGQMALGDGWWDLAQAAEGMAKTQLQRRAGYWYRRAMPGLDGLVQDRVAKRLDQVPSEADPVAHVSRPERPPEHVIRPVPSAPGMTGRWTERIQYGDDKGKAWRILDFQNGGGLTVTNTVRGERTTGRWVRAGNTVRLFYQDGSQKNYTIAAETATVIDMLVDGKRPYRWERAPAPAAVDLLRLVNPKTHAMAGKWQLTSSGLSTPDEFGAFLKVPHTLPAAYDIEIVIRRLGGTNAFVLFPVLDGRRFCITLDSHNGESTTASLIDGDLTLHEGRLLVRGQPVKITCSVRPSGFKLFLGDKELGGWQGPSNRIGYEDAPWLAPIRSMKNSPNLLLGSHAMFQVTQLKLIAVGSAGE